MNSRKSNFGWHKKNQKNNLGLIKVLGFMVLLPAYQESKDITAYLSQLKHFTSLLRTEDDTLAVRLGSVLTGKVAEIYSTADTTSNSNLSLLKQASLIVSDATPKRNQQ